MIGGTPFVPTFSGFYGAQDGSKAPRPRAAARMIFLFFTKKYRSELLTRPSTVVLTAAR